MDVAASTVQTLVDVFKFSLERSQEAVAAIGDKSDIQLAYNWLLDHGEKDQGGPVVPSQVCPHLFDQLRVDPAGMSFVTVCDKACCDRSENWMCLHCGASLCSRYAANHSLDHFKETGHCVALSLSDISTWCYECDKYVKHDRLFPILKRMEVLKFGELSLSNPDGAVQAAEPPAVFMTGLCYDKRTEKHAPPPAPAPAAADGGKGSSAAATAAAAAQLDNPRRTRTIVRTLEEMALAAKCKTLPCPSATDQELARVHTRDYLARVQATAIPSQSEVSNAGNLAEGVLLDAMGARAAEAESAEAESDLYAVPASAAAARLGAGSVLAISRAVRRGSLLNGFALCRPPGHHARANSGGGFCLFNNVAVAVADVLAEDTANTADTAAGTAGAADTAGAARCAGAASEPAPPPPAPATSAATAAPWPVPPGALSRVLVLDWDVHHGDGLQVRDTHYHTHSSMTH